MTFTLPGTHGTVYGWIPPPGIPDKILFQIRKQLFISVKQALAQTSIVSHSRHSSDAGSEPDATRDIEYGFRGSGLESEIDMVVAVMEENS